MKISAKMQTAINDQITAELNSAYIYLGMVAYFENEGLEGFAKWMKVQANEEVEHAMKFFYFVFERGGSATLDKLDKPEVSYKTPLDAFRTAYKHEQFISKRIDDLVDIARKLDDKATESFLKWYTDEQVEEEDNTLKIVQKLERVGDSVNGLMMMNKALGERKE